jgi:hypothetical protein
MSLHTCASWKSTSITQVYWDQRSPLKSYMCGFWLWLHSIIQWSRIRAYCALNRIIVDIAGTERSYDLLCDLLEMWNLINIGSAVATRRNLVDPIQRTFMRAMMAERLIAFDLRTEGHRFESRGILFSVSWLISPLTSSHFEKSSILLARFLFCSTSDQVTSDAFRNRWG